MSDNRNNTPVPIAQGVLVEAASAILRWECEIFDNEVDACAGVFCARMETLRPEWNIIEVDQYGIRKYYIRLVVDGQMIHASQHSLKLVWRPMGHAPRPVQTVAEARWLRDMEERVLKGLPPSMDLGSFPQAGAFLLKSSTFDKNLNDTGNEYE
jgi:hypothetical protein